MSACSVSRLLTSCVMCTRRVSSPNCRNRTPAKETPPSRSPPLSAGFAPGECGEPSGAASVPQRQGLRPEAAPECKCNHALLMPPVCGPPLQKPTGPQAAGVWTRKWSWGKELVEHKLKKSRESSRGWRERREEKKKRKSLVEIEKGWIEGMLRELKGQQGMLRSSREERARTSRRRPLLEEGVAGDGVAKGGISRREELWQGLKASRLGSTW